MRPAEWVRLTNRLVENAKPSSVDEFLRDQELKGFGVRVRPSGVKTFFLEYRSPVDGRFRRLKVGRYPELSGEAARMQAKQAKGARLMARETRPRGVCREARCSKRDDAGSAV